MDLRAALAGAERDQGLVTPSVLRCSGIGGSVLSRACAAGTVVRIRRGVYAAARLAPLPRFVVTDQGVAAAYVAHVRAALLSLGGTATACGRTAAALRGWGLLVEPSRVIEVAVPHGRGRARARGVRITQRRRLAREPVEVLTGTSPLWLTTPLRTVLDCCLSLPLVEAVVACDSALRARAVSMGELLQAAGRQSGVRSARRIRRVLQLADPESGSVLESVLRCHLLLAGIDGFTTQRVLRAAGGQYVLRVDFCFESCRLVVEADGAKWHPDPGRDRALDNRLACLGYRVLRYTWAEVVHDAERVVAEVLEAICPGGADIHLGTRGTSRAA
jgi:very-short-patch-repair endonuclease